MLFCGSYCAGSFGGGGHCAGCFPFLLENGPRWVPNLKTIKTFLYNSVQHRCLNYLRDLEIRDRNYRNLKREELDEDYFLCQQIRAEVVAELFGAIDELPDKCKEIFKRSYVDGQEDKKIAEELDISLNTIKTQKQRAKSYLRGRLGDLFVYAGMFFPGL